ncbi:DUF1604-domain-containing protein [Hymenopellis radicata]|nr:DUF1604-domain-containing protein [Hymenopellis radicata]
MSTGRLKRKLGDLGVDTSSRKANENFCLIGTPLPPLEKSKDTGEFVPLWKQDVRDEKGRRRLHGAFTGGFSAGYFNSVGSKEGWIPQTFVSSRNDRAKKVAARPEDYMDDEDLQELKDSRKVVDTTDEMEFGTAKQPVVDPENDSIASKLEASMLPAPKDSAGARILKKMGWRMGQGVGPRVSLKQRKLQDLQAFTGQARTSDDINVVEDDEASKHTYAPRDTPVITFDRKDNFHGLRYQPGMGLHESLGVRTNGAKPSGPVISAGFGLGALNDADDDDLDVYDGGPSARNRVAYDFGDAPQDDTIVIGSNKAKGKQPEMRSISRTFNDGKPLLAGFVPADKPALEDRWFPLPDVPRDKENIERPPAPTTSSHHDWKRSAPTADERGALLGEIPLPAAPRSVFEYMSKKDRERIQNIATSGIPRAPGATSTSEESPASSVPQTLVVPHLDPHIATAALRGFQPFTSDPEKQFRYKSYLQSQADPVDSPFSLKPSPGQRIEEFNKELADYSKSAQIFKPMSGAMAGRFTSATVIEHGPKIHEGLHQPTEEEIAAKEEEERKKQEDNLTPKQHAARLEMYGPMTRETKPWQPARLLCKRFGVKDPNPPPEEDTRPPTSSAEAYEAEAPAPDATFFPPPSAQPSSSDRRDLNNIGLGEDDNQGRDTLTYERPSMDVFKAIFASDDEDSDDEKEDKEMDVDPPAEEKQQPPPVVLTVSGEQKAFKPTFIPREGKAKEKEETKDKEKKRKKKDKEKKKVLVSFAMDEEGGTEANPAVKKKRRKEKHRKPVEEDDDSMWVEKPPPVPIPPPDTPDVSHKGRKRAIDFM